MSIRQGGFVSWSSSGGRAQGKIVSIHNSGNVPDIPVKVTGTKDSPAARIQVYKKVRDGWEPDEVYVGHKVDALTEIEPLKPPSKSVSAASAILQAQLGLVGVRLLIEASVDLAVNSDRSSAIS